MIAVFLLVFAFGVSQPAFDVSGYSEECLEKAYKADKQAGGDAGNRYFAFVNALEKCK